MTVCRLTSGTVSKVLKWRRPALQPKLFFLSLLQKPHRVCSFLHGEVSVMVPVDFRGHSMVIIPVET